MKHAKRVYATVVYTKTNNDGFKAEGAVYPSSEAQTELLKGFYEDLDMDPRKICYLETHGTGTTVGDPVECKAIDKVFCQNRKGPLLIGSVKSNLGHTEGAAGLVSLTKLLIAFENGSIPPNINYEEPRKEIPSLVEGRLKVVATAEKLQSNLVALNSFGMGGSNGHVLLKMNGKEKVSRAQTSNLPRLLLWSGRTIEAVKHIFSSVAGGQLDDEFFGLLQSSQTISHLGNVFKGFGIFAQSKDETSVSCLNQHVVQFDGEKRPIVWVYSGKCLIFFSLNFFSKGF